MLPHIAVRQTETCLTDVLSWRTKSCVFSPVCLFQGRLSAEASWAGHSLEAWVARWDSWRPRTLYSGGDDSAFCWCGPSADPPRHVQQFGRTQCLIHSPSLREDCCNFADVD